MEEQKVSGPMASRALGGTAHRVLELQRAIGNRAVQRLLQKRSDHGTLQRSLLQREDQVPDPKDGTDTNPARKDPITSQGGPVDTGDKSLQCGLVNGQFQCGVDVGKGDPLQVSGDALPSRGRPAAGGPPSKTKATCPEDRYAWGMDQCCGSGTHVSENGANCVRDPPGEMPPIPPAVPEQKGDFETVPAGPDASYS